jgi:hypothetical protein
MVVRTDIRTYMCTYHNGTNGTMVLEYVHECTRVPWYHMVPYGTIGTIGTMVPWYSSTMVPWYHGTRVRTMVPWYTCTNITLSQKRLEIQALRCNSGRCQHRRHHGILQLRFQLDSVPWYVWQYTCTMLAWYCIIRREYYHMVPLVPMVHVYVL